MPKAVPKFSKATLSLLYPSKRGGAQMRPEEAIGFLSYLTC